MREQKRIYDMSDRELRAYKRRVRRQREIRRRCMTIIMTLCFILVGTISYHSFITKASAGDDTLLFKYYTKLTVQSGDTLWNIAEEYIDYEKYESKSDYISEVQSINHLKNDDIYVGQTLVVPYYSSEYVK